MTEGSLPPSEDDLFANLDKLRTPQDFSMQVAVKKQLVHVSARNPKKAEFIRVNPDDDYRMPASLYINREEGEEYLVLPAVARNLPEFVTPVILVTSVNRRGDVFLWPLKQSKPDSRGSGESWYNSAMECAKLAEDNWLRVASNMTASSYEPYLLQVEIEEPQWPELELRELIKLAFRGKLIADDDHPVINELLGRA